VNELLGDPVSCVGLAHLALRDIVVAKRKWDRKAAAIAATEALGDDDNNDEDNDDEDNDDEDNDDEDNDNEDNDADNNNGVGVENNDNNNKVDVDDIFRDGFGEEDVWKHVPVIVETMLLAEVYSLLHRIHWVAGGSTTPVMRLEEWRWRIYPTVKFARNFHSKLVTNEDLLNRDPDMFVPALPKDIADEFVQALYSDSVSGEHSEPQASAIPQAPQHGSGHISKKSRVAYREVLEVYLNNP
jgi:hypothetical protein